MNSAALPPPELLQQQAAWLAPARARLLRQAGIAHRRPILDLGAGYGAVTGELARRGRGLVVALDREVEALQQIDGAVTVAADAHNLPLASASFDLVFCQCVLLWLSKVATAVSEIRRILQPGGVFIALEPDFGGLIEHPPEIISRDLWLSALKRAGADPFIGRKLPGVFAQTGFKIKVQLLDEMMPPDDGRFNYLRSLPLLESEARELDIIMQTCKKLDRTWEQMAHLPFLLIQAEKA